ncbi:helix-turn-helix domain-containing protein [Sphingobacterium athyrii]|uniref:AraC family transcriptional regulator n=1 Tax=Sphingobacterium athyrii TaxID=2152717 RepID=A0A363NX45_9SPHI|nr:AraC family transcriptional regulator [Sphingobacterium athyrii]PUV25317.1 AraC family transcriptional regulator [Sphingobacterium athyrii]
MAKKITTTIKEYHLNQHQPEKAQFTVHDLKGYLIEHQGNATKPHIHSFYQIIWFKSGIGKHFVDFKEYEIFENAIFFIAKNQVHYFDENVDYEGYLLHFSELFLGQSDNGIDFLVKCSLFNNPYQTPSCCIGYGIEYILEEYIRLIRTELLSGAGYFGQEELLRTYLKSFLIQVQRRKIEFEQNEGKTPFALDDKRSQLIQFVNLLDENYTKGYSVAEYAEKMHISTRTLSDITSQTLNKTPSQIIQGRIVLEAQRMLVHSNFNINEIGYKLGFDDPSYFVKYFKKHVGSSPSEFRKSIQ